jgi:hypothetical protein
VVHSVQATLLRAGCIYEGLPSGGPHKPQSFSALLHLRQWAAVQVLRYDWMEVFEV